MNSHNQRHIAPEPALLSFSLSAWFKFLPTQFLSPSTKLLLSFLLLSMAHYTTFFSSCPWASVPTLAAYPMILILFQDFYPRPTFSLSQLQGWYVLHVRKIFLTDRLLWTVLKLNIHQPLLIRCNFILRRRHKLEENRSQERPKEARSYILEKLDTLTVIL